MRAFLSYSFNDSEQYILTILARRLREQGFNVASSSSVFSNTVSSAIAAQISKSNLFIGIITYTGNANQRVFNEWKTAMQKGLPTLLLIEEYVKVDINLKRHPNVLIFSRHQPNNAITIVNQRIQQARQQNHVRPANDNTAGWILGGLAALAIIGILSDND